MVEYAFILVLVALVILVMLITTGSQVRNMYSDITYTLNNEAGLSRSSPAPLRLQHQTIRCKLPTRP